MRDASCTYVLEELRKHFINLRTQTADNVCTEKLSNIPHKLYNHESHFPMSSGATIVDILRYTGEEATQLHRLVLPMTSIDAEDRTFPKR